MANNIKMVDLSGQYLRIQKEVDQAIREVLQRSDFIQGSEVNSFEQDLSNFIGGSHVISCGNGTDALQIAMMALGFKPGDEVILPVHTYVATAEVIALLRLSPVFVDVDEATFTLDLDQVSKAVTSRTVAVVPVHLYGQCANMEPLLQLAKRHQIHVIEDAAQAIGALYSFSDGTKRSAGTMGTVGTTSFFPSKNLGAYGDGGALFCNDEKLATTLRMVANHGQREKYHHEVIGVNSRLDTIQAAILRIKLKYLNDFIARRQRVADFYDQHLSNVAFLDLPYRAAYSTHVFHQYTVIAKGIDRDKFKQFLEQRGIPSMIYYPLPLHHQKAYRQAKTFPVTERLSEHVISLPIHTEMDEDQLSYICNTIKEYN